MRTPVRNAFAAFGCQRDGSAILHDARSGGHSLHRLIQIHVERVTTVRRHHDTKRPPPVHRGRTHEVDPNAMRCNKIAGEYSRNLAPFVEGNIHQETWAGAQRDVAHFLPQRIAVRDAEGRLRVTDVLRSVVAHHCRQRRDTGHDPFRPTAKARKEMRFDEPGDDSDLRLRKQSIDQCWRSAPRVAELNVRREILAT